jgi:hypothetical protein
MGQHAETVTVEPPTLFGLHPPAPPSEWYLF